MSKPQAGKRNLRALPAVLLLVSALGFLAYRLYSTSGQRTDARLFLSDDIRLNPVPGAPDSDKNPLKHQLQSVAEMGARILRSPDDAAQWLDYAQAALQAGDNLSGRAALRHVIGKWNPKDSAVYDALSTCARELGLLVEAEAAARKEVSLAPNELGGYVNLAKVHIQRSQPVKAKEALMRASSAIPESDVKSRLELSRHFDDRLEPTLSLKEAETALNHSRNDPGAQLAVANLILKQGRLEEAEGLLKKIEAKQPDVSNLHRLLGVLYSSPQFHGRDLKQAEHHYLRSLQLDDRNVRSVIGLSAILLERQRYKQAAFAYGRLLELDPRNTSARFNLAQCYQRMGDAPAAASQRKIANALLKWQESLIYLKGQRNKHFSDPSKRIPLANHYMDGGNYTEALVELQSACALSNNLPKCTRTLMAFYDRLGAPPSPLIAPAMKAGARPE